VENFKNKISKIYSSFVAYWHRGKIKNKFDNIHVHKTSITNTIRSAGCKREVWLQADSGAKDPQHWWNW